MGDGELNEGQVWEAIMQAGKERLHNIVLFIDRNNIQIDGFTEDIMPLEPLSAKFESFNWHVQEIDGHNMRDIIGAVGTAKAIFEKPSVIIAHTIAGKGVDEFERDFKWHGVPPNQEQAMSALAQIRTMNGRVSSEHQ
jgi:transketolase